MQMSPPRKDEATYPTEQFINLEPKYPSIDISELHKIIPLTYFLGVLNVLQGGKKVEVLLLHAQIVKDLPLHFYHRKLEILLSIHIRNISDSEIFIQGAFIDAYAVINFNP